MPPESSTRLYEAWENAKKYKPDQREFDDGIYTKVGQLNKQTSRAGDSVWARIRTNANAAYKATLVDDDGNEIIATRVYNGDELDATRARPWDILDPIVALDLLPVNSKEAAGAFFRVMYLVQEEAHAKSVKLADILKSVIDYDRPSPRLRRDHEVKPSIRKRRRLSAGSSIDVVDSRTSANNYMTNDSQLAASRGETTPTFVRATPPTNGTLQSRPSPVTPAISARLPTDRLARSQLDTSTQYATHIVKDASVNKLASSHTLESLSKHQQQLEKRQKLDNAKITQLLSDITALDKKISELQETHVSDLEPCFEHIRETCLSECIKMVTIIRSSPNMGVEALPNAHTAAGDLAVRGAHTTSVERITTEVQSRQRKQRAEPSGNIRVGSSRILGQETAEGRASTSRKNDPIEDASSDAAATNEDSSTQGHHRTTTAGSADAIQEQGDPQESDYS